MRSHAEEGSRCDLPGILLITAALLLRHERNTASPRPRVRHIQVAGQQLPAAEESRVGEADLETSDPGALRGRVLDFRGQSLAAAKVRAVRLLEHHGYFTYGKPAEALAEWEASTDTSGRFHLEGLPPGQVLVEASAEGEFPRSIEVGLPAEDALEIVLPGKATISGRVLVETGDPLPYVPVNAEVDGKTCEALTGPDGGYRLLVPQGRISWIEASPPHRSPLRRPPQDRSPPWLGGGPGPSPGRIDSTGREVDFIFQAGTAIQGIVVEPGGGRASGAAVTVIPLTGTPGEEWSEKADPGGRFLFEGLAPGGRFLFEGLAPGAYLLSAESPSGILHRSRFPYTEEEGSALDLEKIVLSGPGSKKADVCLRLQAFADVRGVVLDSQDRPVTGAWVHVSAFSMWHRSQFTGNRGEFRFEVPPRARYQLGVTAPDLVEGGEYTLSSFKVLEPGELREGHLLRFEPPGTARILVTDEEDQPIEGAVVQGTEAPWDTGSALRRPSCGDFPERLTGADGWLESRAWPGVIYILEVHAAGHTPSLVVLDRSAQPPIERRVRLARLPPAVLRGSVVTPDGKPVAGATVRVFPLEDGDRVLGLDGVKEGPMRSRLSASTDTNGGFSIVGLDGKYLLFASADGYPEVEVPEVEAGEGRVRVVLSPGLEIEGDVAFDSGEPAPFVTVSAEAARWQVKTLADGSGSFRLRGIGPDCHDIYASGEAIFHAAAKPPPPPGGRIRIVVRARPVFEGTILDPDGEPVRHAEVPVKLTVPGGESVSFYFETDHQGRYRLRWEASQPPASSTRLEIRPPDRISTEGWLPITLEGFTFGLSTDTLQFMKN